MSSTVRVLRSIAAVIAGYSVLALMVYAGDALAGRALLGPETPGDQSRLAYVTANLAVSVAAAVAAGWITAAVAPAARLTHSTVLAALLLVGGLAVAVSGGAARPGQPAWYPWILPLMGALGAVTGGLIRALRTARGG